MRLSWAWRQYSVWGRLPTQPEASWGRQAALFGIERFNHECHSGLLRSNLARFLAQTLVIAGPMLMAYALWKDRRLCQCNSHAH